MKKNEWWQIGVKMVGSEYLVSISLLSCFWVEGIWFLKTVLQKMFSLNKQLHVRWHLRFYRRDKVIPSIMEDDKLSLYSCWLNSNIIIAVLLLVLLLISLNNILCLVQVLVEPGTPHGSNIISQMRSHILWMAKRVSLLFSFRICFPNSLITYF